MSSNWLARKGYAERAAYKSGLECDVVKDLESKGIDFQYESTDSRIYYEVPAKTRFYTPDFFITTKSGKKIIVETKGLWTAEDREKHRLIKLQYPDLDIRFVFTRSKAKIRKGSKTTYADVCEGKARAPFKGLTWLYADKTIPQEWLDE